ncbi:MAG TPA: 4-alpha-glucanotransferase, partial [Pyrinomonadaceae bacterium]
MSFPRTSGVILHPTSLPGRYGVGDLGDEAYKFIDFLASAGQHLWQVLPLGPTGYGNSPYQCFSAFAGNTLLVSPERLLADGLLGAADVADAPEFVEGEVEYGRAIEFKNALLRKAFENFRAGTEPSIRSEFDSFRHDAADWLDDYALYRALKRERGEIAWTEWEPALV